MKQILFLLIVPTLSVQFSCTTSATSGELVNSEVQEASVAKNISATDFNKYINEKHSAIILDVRTPAEVAQGYIESAINIDFNSPKFKSQLEKLDKTKPVLVYCRSGRRSASAMSYMKDIGFSEVYNLNGGIISWGQAGLKIAK